MNGVNAHLRQVQHGQGLFAHHILCVHSVDNHTHGGGVVRDRVNQDEGTGLLVACVGIEEELLTGREDDPSDLVQLQLIHGGMFHRVDIHLITDAIHSCAGRVGGLLDVELLVDIHLLLVHPN